MRILLGIIIGAGIGFCIGYFFRCSNGVCALTRNPIVTTILGAIIGALIATGK